MAAATSGGLRAQFAEQGFVVLRGAIPAPLLSELRVAVRPLQAAQAAGKTESPQRHQTCLEPAWFQHAFIDFLNLEANNRAAAEIIGVDDPAELCGGASLLAVLLGHDEDHCLQWHRDHGERGQTTAMWQRASRFIQTNCALYDDPSLWVVPGSHNRPSTAAEGHWAATHPSGKLPLPEHHASLSGMPGSINVPLQAGDCVLYNSLIWHAASYLPAAVRPRATFHSGWRHPDVP
jgi:hypothetical protein